jgi:hypothetical protein
LLRAAELAELLERRCLRSLLPLEVRKLVEVSGLVRGWERAMAPPVLFFLDAGGPDRSIPADVRGGKMR